MVRFHPVLNYKILTLSEEEIRPPEKNDKWPLKDSRGKKGFTSCNAQQA